MYVSPVTIPTAEITVYTPVNTGKPAAIKLPKINSRITSVIGPEINSASMSSFFRVISKVTSMAKFPVTHFCIPSGASLGS